MLATPTHSFVVYVGYRSDQMFAYIGSSYATTKYQHLGSLTVSYATTQCDVPASTHRGEGPRGSTNGNGNGVLIQGFYKELLLFRSASI